jgi:hypothetical protein
MILVILWIIQDIENQILRILDLDGLIGLRNPGLQACMQDPA